MTWHEWWSLGPVISPRHRYDRKFSRRVAQFETSRILHATTQMLLIPPSSSQSTAFVEQIFPNPQIRLVSICGSCRGFSHRSDGFFSLFCFLILAPPSLVRSRSFLQLPFWCLSLSVTNSPPVSDLALRIGIPRTQPNLRQKKKKPNEDAIHVCIRNHRGQREQVEVQHVGSHAARARVCCCHRVCALDRSGAPPHAGGTARDKHPGRSGRRGFPPARCLPMERHALSAERFCDMRSRRRAIASSSGSQRSLLLDAMDLLVCAQTESGVYLFSFFLFACVTYLVLPDPPLAFRILSLQLNLVHTRVGLSAACAAAVSSGMRAGEADAWSHFKITETPLNKSIHFPPKSRACLVQRDELKKQKSN